MKGYPIGTVCVVTWVDSTCRSAKIGDIVTVISEPFIWMVGGITPYGSNMRGLGQNNGMLVQRTDRQAFGLDGKWCTRVAWLRPLQDPDAEKVTEREREEA